MTGNSLLSDIPSDDSYETDYSIGDITLISGSTSAGSVYGDDNKDELEVSSGLGNDELEGECNEESIAEADMETTSGQQFKCCITQTSELQQPSACESPALFTIPAEQTQHVN